VTALSIRLQQIKSGYTDGARHLASQAVTVLRRSPITPNQLTAIGFSLNVVAAVLIFREAYIAAGIVFLIGSIADILDGALARMRGQASRLGAFIDSTTDRISEGFVLGAAALVFARNGTTWAIAAVIVALVCSFLISYTRARAEALGFEGKAGLMGRAERVVLLGAVLLAAPWGALPYGVALMAVLTALTVVQRVYSVARQIDAADRESAAQRSR
jgi:CDP-diacylglycerol--glycerol-3-phosphate 3-phosphatidyltransferase